MRPFEISPNLPRIGAGFELNPFNATTRLYLHSAVASPVGNLPAPEAAYTDINEALWRAMTNVVNVDAMADGTTIDWTAGNVALDRIYIGPTMAGGTIPATATVKCQIRARELAAADNVQQRLGLRVISRDGSVVRGTLLSVAFYGVATELAAGAGLTNRFYANGDAVSALAIQTGDRFALSLGYADSAGTTPEALASYGSIAASDLPEDETTSTALRPWFQITIP